MLIVCTYRFSDFIVNEIDVNGKTVHLTDLDYNEEEDEKEAESKVRF